MGKKITVFAGPAPQKFFFKAGSSDLDFEGAISDFVGAIIGADAYAPENPMVKHGNSLIKKHLMAKERLDFFVQIATAVTKQKVLEWHKKGVIDDLFRECSQLVMDINTLCFLGNQAWKERGQEFNNAFYDIEQCGFDLMVLFLPWFPSKGKAKLNKAKKIISSVITEACSRVRSGEAGVCFVGYCISDRRA